MDVLGEDLLRMENLLGVELDVKSGDTIQVVPSGRTHNLIWSLVCLEIHNQFIHPQALTTASVTYWRVVVVDRL